eukprot:5381454-Pleurochrysis_carterae.AAC.1
MHRRAVRRHAAHIFRPDARDGGAENTAYACAVSSQATQCGQGVRGLTVHVHLASGRIDVQSDAACLLFFVRPPFGGGGRRDRKRGRDGGVRDSYPFGYVQIRLS